VENEGLEKLVDLLKKMKEKTEELLNEQFGHVCEWDEKPPEVTILLPTYKRCDLLKEALESALQQEDVRDYQIIVADNEGVSISAETETSLFMRDYVDSRVIYYRYDRQISWAMDAVAALAKSKWICFLHDDDVLAPNYLKIMLQMLWMSLMISVDIYMAYDNDKTSNCLVWGIPC